MDEHAFLAAKQRLRRANLKLQSMKLAKNIDELVDSWSEFLVEVQRFYTRLRKATERGASKGWSDQVRNVRKNDPLLSYVHHARNADEHGLKAVTRRVPPAISIGDEGEHVTARVETDRHGRITLLNVTQGTVRYYPAVAVMVPVVDRGITYRVPREHMGNPIHTDSPIVVAELTVRYLERLVQEAEQRFGGDKA